VPDEYLRYRLLFFEELFEEHGQVSSIVVLKIERMHIKYRSAVVMIPSAPMCGDQSGS
jgi:hypothetical protein